MKTILANISLLACLTLSACGAAGPEGSYTLDMENTKMPAEAKTMMNQLAADIELKADGTYAGKMSFELPEALAKLAGGEAKQEQEMTGSWKLEGSTITFTDDSAKGDAKTCEYADGAFTMKETNKGMTLEMAFKRK